MKLFPKSFRRRRLFKKRRHPKTFIIFLSMSYFQIISKAGRPLCFCSTGTKSGRYPHPRAPRVRVSHVTAIRA
ncbi:hypothetical protein F1645_14290 [Novacetimonas hansenii]